MNNHKSFKRGGRGVFNCAICERSTREAGQANNELCPDCFEVAGYENSVLDGHETAEQAQQHVASYIRNISEKGGNMEKFYGSFATIFPDGPKVAGG